MTVQLSTDLVVGLVVGGVGGLIVGFLIGVVSNSKKSKMTGKKGRAHKLFDSAMKEEDRKRKLKLLAQIVDKHPNSEWADKALEQVMKLRKDS